MLHLHDPVRSALAVAVALAACASPAAAMFELAPPQPASAAGQPTTSPCSDACSGAGYGLHTQVAATMARSGAQLPHDPRPRSTVVTGVQPAVGSWLCGDVCSGHGYGSVGVTTSAPAGSGLCGDVCSGHGYGSVGATTSALSVRPHSTASGGGFDWGDAGIGAGGAFALTIIGLGGVFAATNHRRRQPQHQHQQASANS